MATRTNNYGLIKPTYDDNIDVQNLNDNMDVLDDKLKTIEDNVSSNAKLIKSVEKQLPNYMLKTGDTMTGTLVMDDCNISSINRGYFAVHNENNNKLELSSDYSQLVTTDDNGKSYYLQLNKNGQLYVPQVTNLTGDFLGLVANSSSNYINIHKNGTIYLGGAAIIKSDVGTTCTIASPNGKWLNVDNDGYANCTKGTICYDHYDSGINSMGEWKYFELSKYTAMMCFRVYNANSQVDTVYITFPRPFLDTSYTVACSTRRLSDESDIRINADYRATVSECSATGLRVGRDRLVDTQIIIIGRIA